METLVFMFSFMLTLKNTRQGFSFEHRTQAFRCWLDEGKVFFVVNSF